MGLHYWFEKYLFGVREIAFALHLFKQLSPEFRRNNAPVNVSPQGGSEISRGLDIKLPPLGWEFDKFLLPQGSGGLSTLG